MKQNKFVVQIQTKYGWETVSEHLTADEARKHAMDTYYHNYDRDNWRIREKDRKPRKDCWRCKGKGTHKDYDTREGELTVYCKCLRD